MLIQAHSGLRYLVLLTGVACIAYAIYGLAKGRPYDKRMRILAAAFVGSIDLTVLAGVAAILAGSFYPGLGGHVAMMILATAVVHIVSAVTKRRPPEERTYAPHVVGTAIALALVVMGTLALGRPVVG